MNKKENRKTLKGVLFLTLGVLVLSVLSLGLSVSADDGVSGLHALNISTNNLTFLQNSNKTSLNRSALRKIFEKRIMKRGKTQIEQRLGLVNSEIEDGSNNSYEIRGKAPIEQIVGRGGTFVVSGLEDKFLFGNFFRGEGFVVSGSEGNLIKLNLIFTKGNTSNEVKNFIGTLGILGKDRTLIYKIKGTLDRTTNVLDFHTLKSGFSGGSFGSSAPLFSFEGALNNFNSFRLLRGSLYKGGEVVRISSLTVFSKKRGKIIPLKAVRGKDGKRFSRGNFTSSLNQSVFIGSNESAQNNQSNISFSITPKIIKNRRFLFWNLGKKVVLEIHKGNETFEKTMNEDSTELIDGYRIHVGRLNSTEDIPFNITKEGQS